MPLNRFVGQEPIITHESALDPRNDELIRYSVDPPYNVITWIQPTPSQLWEIEAIHLDLQTSGNVGTRDVYVYVYDKNGQLIRFEAFSSAAAFSNYFMGIPGANWGGAAISATARTFLGPCPVKRLLYPCRIGVLLAGFDGGDVFHFNLLVRERRLQT